MNLFIFTFYISNFIFQFSTFIFKKFYFKVLFQISIFNFHFQKDIFKTFRFSPSKFRILPQIKSLTSPRNFAFPPIASRFLALEFLSLILKFYLKVLFQVSIFNFYFQKIISQTFRLSPSKFRILPHRTSPTSPLILKFDLAINHSYIIHQLFLHHPSSITHSLFYL